MRKLFKKIFETFSLNLFYNNRFFKSGKKKDEDKGQCSTYKGPCGGVIGSKCCKIPYKCAKQTKICGKDRLCCVTEADIQRHKQDSGPWLKDRNGK